MKQASLILVAFLVSFQVSFSQESINQFDQNGKRHGKWKKYYPGTKQLRYEGQFNHGVETGTFQFYCEDCKNQPMAVKEFSSDGKTANVKYYTIEGKLVSEGKMEGKNRIGEWVYFHKGSNEVMTREHYTNGALHGVKTTFYPNGNKTEETHYQNGIKQGDNIYYSTEGVMLKKLQYKDDKLQGPATYNDANGNITIKGYYKNGKKDGVWEYYKDGQIQTTETFPKIENRN